MTTDFLARSSYQNKMIVAFARSSRHTRVLSTGLRVEQQQNADQKLQDNRRANQPQIKHEQIERPEFVKFSSLQFAVDQTGCIEAGIEAGVQAAIQTAIQTDRTARGGPQIVRRKAQSQIITCRQFVFEQKTQML